MHHVMVETHYHNGLGEHSHYGKLLQAEKAGD